MVDVRMSDSRSEEVRERRRAQESLGGSRSTAASLSGRLRQTPHDRHAALNEVHHLNHYRGKKYRGFINLYF